jgi:hypothetical protein
MDWALIESACYFPLAAVSPQMSTPNLAHIRPHPVRRYQKRGIQFRERKTDATLGKSLKNKQINARSLARSIGNQKDPKIGNPQETTKGRQKTIHLGA